MAVKRPAIISVVGILNIIFASLGLLTIICCGPFSFIDTQQMMKAMAPQGAAVGQQPADANPMANMNEVPGYTAFVGAGLVVGLVTSTLLLGSGIGLLKMKRWGRGLGFTYALLGLLWGTGATFINQRLVGPKIVQMYEKFQEDMKKAQTPAGAPVPPVAQPKQGEPADATGQDPASNEHPTVLGVYFVVVLIFSTFFPFVELVLMLLPAVRRGLAGIPSPGWEPDAQVSNDSGRDDRTWDETIRQ